MDMVFYYELPPTKISSKGPKAYQNLLKKDLQRRRNRKPGSIPRDFAYLDSKECQLKIVNKWIKQRNDSDPLHPILALYEDRNPIREKSNKSRNHSKQASRLKMGSMLNKDYARNVMKMAKKSPIKRTFHHEDYANQAKGHEHQEMLQPRPDLTIMVQPSKIDYAGWQNNGGVRFFIHRPLTVPTDTRDSIEVDNNVEAFINLEYDDINSLSREFQRDRGCLRRVSRKNLWFDLEVELSNPLTYTWDSCIHEWQAKTMFKACKCLPHYYSELFDYWWNMNLRCNHHGLKCMALVNGKSYSKTYQFYSNLSSHLRYIIHVQFNMGKYPQAHSFALSFNVWSQTI